MSDLISREEVLKLPQRKGYAVNGWETYIRVSDIKELPSVPRRGKWIEASEDWRNQITWWQCSECGTPSSIKSNFCPNCGADMREGD